MTLVLVTGDENTGQQFRVPAPNRPEGLQVSTMPPGSLGIPTDSGSAAATTALNTADTNGSGVFVAPTGDEFAIVHAPSADWDFDADTCFFTYLGPAGKRFLFTLVASIKVQFEGGGGTGWMGIDQDVSMVGFPALLDFTESIVTFSFTTEESNADIIKTITTTRLVEPTTGQTFQPAFAYNGGTAFFNILRLTLSFVQVGPGGG